MNKNPYKFSVKMDLGRIMIGCDDDWSDNFKWITVKSSARGSGNLSKLVFKGVNDLLAICCVNDVELYFILNETKCRIDSDGCQVTDYVVGRQVEKCDFEEWSAS